MIHLQPTNIVLVEVPKGASGFELWKPYHIKGKLKSGGMGFNIPVNAWEEIEIGYNHYTLIGTTDKVSEEDCRGLVESEHYSTEFNRERKISYKDYTDGTMMTNWTSLESWNSLLKANKVNQENVYAILKMNDNGTRL